MNFAVQTPWDRNVCRSMIFPAASMRRARKQVRQSFLSRSPFDATIQIGARIIADTTPMSV
ncbi:hypothetical protein ANO14919_136990 [Xylariales sp. No.14919]|nr:hypothetical protein ANO14919_136990 [Xylariales sp. No.14919]